MPRVQEKSINRFNINTHLAESWKFKTLRKTLSFDESRTWTVITRLWCFVAQNLAMNGSIADVEDWLIADFCWWDTKNDGDPAILIQAFKKAGFIEADGTIHDWFDNQPLAAEVLRKRSGRDLNVQDTAKYGEPNTGQTPDESGHIPDECRTNTDVSRTNTGYVRPKQNKTEQNGIEPKEKEQLFGIGVDKIVDNSKKEESSLDFQLLEVGKVLRLNDTDKGTLRYWLGKLAQEVNTSVGSRLIGEMKESMKSKNPPNNPMGLLISKIKKELKA